MMHASAFSAESDSKGPSPLRGVVRSVGAEYCWALWVLRSWGGLVLLAYSFLVRETGKDGAEMVLVPAGDFWMGSTREEADRVIAECKGAGAGESQCKEWYERELPRHRVSLDAFYIDRFEVMNKQFERFVRATGHRTTAERQVADGQGEWRLVARPIRPRLHRPV